MDVALGEHMRTLLEVFAADGAAVAFSRCRPDRPPSLRGMVGIAERGNNNAINVEAMNIKTSDDEVEAALQDVNVLVSTTNAANPLFANLVAGHTKSLK